MDRERELVCSGLARAKARENRFSYGKEGRMMAKTREQLEAEAARLEADAEINEAYKAKMERTTEESHGRLGHLNNPTAYAAHTRAAADKRMRAADLRAAASALGRQAAGVPKNYSKAERKRRRERLAEARKSRWAGSKGQ
jgi:hypothetical protein